MSPTPDIADAIIHVLFVDVAPRWRSELDADPRASIDPGLRAAIAVVQAWLTDLRREHDAALESHRLAEALRRAFVCAAGRGRVCVPDEASRSSWLEVSPADMALLETLRELAGVLDTARGTATVAEFDAHRDTTLARMVALAEHAAEYERRWGSRAWR